ncbi:MAG: hypothetical protein LBT44_01040 [Clostridiales bacterium]|nr:hypothetical protein [Clostridiales bacterium]
MHVHYDIEKLASLSKIDFSAEELRAMEKDMESIMALMDSIKGVNPPPAANPGNRPDDRPDDCPGESARLSELRADTPAASLDLRGRGEFIIPRIIE